MSKIKALITTIALGTSVAAAKGPPSKQAPVTLASSDGASSTWFALTEPQPLSRGRDVIRLGAARGELTQLRFQATQGSSHIERVIVRFLDGTLQTIDLNVKLDATTPITEFTLGGTPRGIDELIVIGASSRRSAVQLFGF